MKNLIGLFFFIVLFTGCDKLSYHKTVGGMPYQLFSGKSGKPIRTGNFVKLNLTQKINDSVYFSTYGKLPLYRRVNETAFPYDISELWTKLKTGDSVVAIQMMDTFIRRSPESMPPQFKNGDRIITYFKILDVFENDSLARIDNDIEMKKDEPRRKKEMEEQEAKAEKEMKAQMEKEDAELIKSGEKDKEFKAIEAYLASKKINAKKTGRGTYVEIKQEGSGPLAEPGDTLTVKYSGRKLVNDSVFEANSYTFPVGKGKVIPGWDEGLLLFRKGGKGTLFIPGFLAYGKNPRTDSPFGPYEALIFDVEVVDIKK